MHKILIVSALSQELNTIKAQIKNLKIKNLKISSFTTGMGNYNTILNLTRFLEKNDFDFLVNIGICGYKNEKVDFFQVSRIFNLANKKEIIVPNLINFGKIESIACSEKSVFNADFEENFVDMESFGFEMVCDSFSIPRLILKVPVDKIGLETKNFDFTKAKKYLGENIDYKTLLEKIENYLNMQKKEIDLEKYFSNFNFTFSEKIIFKKLFLKYKSLVGDDFENYFEENIEEKKEKFLKNLENYLDDFIIK